MPTTNKAWGILGGTVGAFVVFVILLLHNAWGDDRYVQKPAALREQIESIDVELGIVDTEITYAETPRQEAKWTAIKGQYERQKEKRQEQLQKMD